MSIKKYENQIYAGVLGKMLGVYLGRPVEGWSYEKILETFGDIKYYVHEQVGVPLIVADDDISGTFGFFRGIEDNEYDKNLPAKAFGDTWLNYIIENRTILWWGGLGRSTEHTAFLNLKNGIPAPQSGSIDQNGKTLAEQIGAQIFIDAIAMACPNDPDLAVSLVRKAASVSHDGIALEAACHLAALEAMAFEEKDIDTLLDRAAGYVQDKQLLDIIADVRDICNKERDWRKVREYLNPKYGYEVFVGCCHMVPNHAMVIASIILGGDDFQKSISIASSAAWDTDCNAGNVGAFNGIRLGIDGINAGADFRTPVADLMYVVTADGGSVVTDAVIESKRIIETAARMAGEDIEISRERYTFEFPGSVQGFLPCEYDHGSSALVKLGNSNEFSDENGLMIQCSHVADGVSAYAATQTFIDFSKIAMNFSTVASPTLYSSQKVVTKIKTMDDGNVSVRPYILYYDKDDQIQIIHGDYSAIGMEETTMEWIVPDTDGMSIFKLGYEIASNKRFDGRVVITSIDWKGAPKLFAQRGMLMTSIWNTNPLWLAGFASSAAQFAADFKQTYCISHIDEDGLVTIGTRDWDDYSVKSTAYFSLHESGGLVIRSRGHKRYYGAILNEYKYAKLFVQKDGKRTILEEVPYTYEEDKPYELVLSAKGNHISFTVNGAHLIEAVDETYVSGGAGFIISKGTMTCDSFIVESK
ncbi:MAG TPA: ADP-ribosylglycohydrolase family protein [Candidatus Pelethocola excrementipullorum]|nr:ADP-ribosylglycohydrolase family protein [Candidatus Pelethocola excrementipullorum]